MTAVATPVEGYEAFLRAKFDFQVDLGFEVAPDELSPALLGHQAAIVRQEFRRDASLIGVDVRFVRHSDEVDRTSDTGVIYLTNYETSWRWRLDGRVRRLRLPPAAWGGHAEWCGRPFLPRLQWPEPPAEPEATLEQWAARALAERRSA